MTKEKLYEFLDKKGLSYDVTEHMAVFTIEEMLRADLPHPEIVAKNLFVRDDKKRNYYLITVKEDRTVNLKEFRQQFGTRALSFASEDELMDILGLYKGAVTPFGLLNDQEKKVQFFIDREFASGRLGIHPLENTATVWIEGKDLIGIIKEHGNSVVEF